MKSTPLPEATDLTKTTITDLVATRWEQIASRFDSVMSESLSAERLAAAWAQVIGAVGAYESHGKVHVSRTGDLTITNTSMRFEAGDLVARITYRDDSSIAGLYIIAPEPGQ